eukprot:NODE_150_length_17275_cov_0.559618.p6 type:complete len:354 gc:universal NODE_150_length_17275_cov_0.559618:2618-3679(+)
MPLITITGYPSSGKSTRSRQLKQLLRRYANESVEYKKQELFGSTDMIDPMSRFFEPQMTIKEESTIAELDKNTLDPIECESVVFNGHKFQVIILSDESLHIDVNLYENSFSEKQARATLLSAVERHLTPDTIVICDALNYIKGFRYQLSCIARAVGTQWCVLHVDTPASISKGWNSKYSDRLFDNLIYRYEEPVASNRWDSPLFTLVYSKCLYSSDMPLNSADHAPLIDICDFVFGGTAKTQNFSTVHKPVCDSNYLQVLNKTTMQVVKDVLKISNTIPGAEIKLYSNLDVVFIMPLRVSKQKLKGLQRSFVNLRTNNCANVSDINSENDENLKTLFIEYLNESLEEVNKNLA